MTDQPLFSIITIAFDDLDALQETVASVRSQSFRDFEHIVVDGQSTDGSAQWLESHFDGIWMSEPDQGRYDAMNKGAQMASGEYVWFLHAGDSFGDASVLERVARLVEDGPEWAYGMARVVDRDKQLTGTMGFAPFSLFKFAVLGHPLPHQATVMRREFLERLGGYDQTVPVAGDQLLLLRAASAAEPVAVADFLCDFDGTGISAGRHWWIQYWDAERNRRRLAAPVTRWRALDTAISFSHAALRAIARRGRDAVSRGGDAPRAGGRERGRRAVPGLLGRASARGRPGS